MEKDIAERVAIAENEIAYLKESNKKIEDNLKESSKKLEARLDGHDTSIHKHGRELQGITMASDAMKDSLDTVKAIMESLPSKIGEAIAPIRDVAQQTKEEFQKYKYMFWGGATIAGTLGSCIVYLLYQVVKLKGFVE